MPNSLSYASESVSLSGVALVGTGPVYTGYPGTGLSDSGEFGVKMVSCPKARLRDLDIRNIRGAGIDFQNSAWRDDAFMSGLSVRDCYRGIYVRNSGEGLLVTNSKVSGCLFGVHVDSGSNNFENGESVFNSIGILVSGGTNNGHGSFSNWNSRHNTFNLSCQNVTNGETFDGCNFTAGQGGSDQGILQIYNSKGILISSGQVAFSDVTVDATSQLIMRGVVLRGTVNFTVTAGGSLDCKNNLVMAGSTITLNGSPFSGNN